MQQNWSENQIKAQAYLDKHQIPEILGDILNTLAHRQLDDPIVYIIKYLGTQVDPEVLQKSGIQIENIETIQSVLNITYPIFQSNNTSFFKNALSRENFLKCKNQATVFGNNLRPIIQANLQNQSHQIGLFAADEDCIRTFSPIFDNVIQSINKVLPKQSGFKCIKEKFSRDHTKSVIAFEEEFQFIEEGSITLKRNLKNYPFNMTLKQSQRQEIAGKIIDALQGVKQFHFNNIHTLNLIREDEKKQLAGNFQNILQDSSQLSQVGIRYNQWPKGRYILTPPSNSQKILVWINKEDHLEIKWFGGQESNIIQYLFQMIRIQEALDQMLNFSFSEEFGYNTVKPNNLGLGLQFSVQIKIPSSHLNQFKNNLNEYQKNGQSFFEFKEKGQKDNYIIQLVRSLGLTFETMITTFENMISCLFNGIVDPKIKQGKMNNNLNKKPSPSASSGSGNQSATSKDSKNDFVAIQIQKQEKQENFIVESNKIIAEKKNVENEKFAISSLREKKVVPNDLSYKQFSQQISEFIDYNQQEYQIFKIRDIINGMKNDLIVLSQEIIQKGFFILRRNISRIPFLSTMKQEDFQQVDMLFFAFVQKVKQNVKANESLKINQNNFFKKSPQQGDLDLNVATQCDYYQQKFNDINLQYNLTQILGMEQDSTSIGSAIYKLPSLTMISNLDDHITIIFEIRNSQISIALTQLFDILFLLESLEPLAYDDKFGFLTHHPQNCGSGISIHYIFRQQIMEKKMDIQSEGQEQMNEQYFSCFAHNPLQIENLCISVNQIIKQRKDQNNFYEILQSYITREQYDEYKALNTEDYINLYDCIFPKDLKIIYKACSVKCFKYYRNLFLKIIQSTNLSMRSTLHVNDFQNEFKGPVIQSEKGMLKVRIEIGRNFKNVPFNMFLNYSDRVNLKNIISSRLSIYKNLQLIQSPHYNTNISSQSLKYKTYDENQLSDETFVYEDTQKKFAIWFFKKDHVRVCLKCRATQLNNAMNQIYRIFESLLSYFNEFQFDEDLGYLSQYSDSLADNTQFEIFGNFRTDEDFIDLTNQHNFSVNVKKNLQNDISRFHFSPIQGSRVFKRDLEFYNELVNIIEKTVY